MKLEQLNEKQRSEKHAKSQDIKCQLKLKIETYSEIK